jgi:uncharacterized protein (DUF2336 family)
MTDSDIVLSPADAERLAGDRSAEPRIALVQKIVRTAELGLLAPGAFETARDLLLRLAHDTVQQVREAVAWQVYNSPLLNDELARRLATDVASVAFPVLRHAEHLADSILLEVIGQGEAAKQMAIAARLTLSKTVSASLADVGNLAVVATLAGNAGAAISDQTLNRLADRYAHVPLIAEPLAGRELLPASVVERLVAGASSLVRDTLIRRHRLSSILATEMAQHGRDSATLALLRPLGRSGMDARAMAVHLHSSGRLGLPIILRAQCSGDFDFFAAAMSVRSRVAGANVAALLADGTGEGLRALLGHAHVPKRLFQPFLLAHQLAQEMNYPGGDHGRADYQAAVLALLYAKCGQSEERAMDDLLLQLFDSKDEQMVDAAMDQAGILFVPLRGTPPQG